MTVEIANTADGLGLNVRVCEDGICKTGFTSSMHLVETKANQLREVIRKQAAEARAAEAEGAGAALAEAAPVAAEEAVAE